MATEKPINCQWDGEAFVPSSPRWASEADKQFVIGERYMITEYHDRSTATHNHEFASIADMWSSLPERYDNEPWAQSPEHLRKYALIMCRYCDTQTYASGSQAEARRWAANLRPIDEYSVVRVEGSTVYRFTAQSQSKRAMGAKLFQESKTAILDYIEGLLGVQGQEEAA